MHACSRARLLASVTSGTASWCTLARRDCRGSFHDLPNRGGRSPFSTCSGVKSGRHTNRLLICAESSTFT
eukprot:18357-Eustigmatos_ZCMA.PRE.1